MAHAYKNASPLRTCSSANILEGIQRIMIAEKPICARNFVTTALYVHCWPMILRLGEQYLLRVQCMQLGMWLNPFAGL